jgi:hypothetical protein
MQKKLVIIVLFSLTLFHSSSGQITETKENEQVRTPRKIGIPITRESFDSLVNASIHLLKAKDTPISLFDYMVMIRLFNTIEENELTDTKSKTFRDLFFPSAIGEAAKAIDAGIGKGMCYYSKKYDLYIGGSPHQNSQYLISEYLLSDILSLLY